MPASEVRTQLAEVVDFPVENKPERVVLAADRLVSAHDVDNRQPAKAEAAAAVRVEIEPLVVGAAVDKLGRHRAQPVGLDTRVGREAHDSSNAAHSDSMLPERRAVGFNPRGAQHVRSGHPNRLSHATT
jgi:hypothetical protein